MTDLPPPEYWRWPRIGELWTGAVEDFRVVVLVVDRMPAEGLSTTITVARFPLSPLWWSRTAWSDLPPDPRKELFHVSRPWRLWCRVENGASIDAWRPVRPAPTDLELCFLPVQDPGIPL